MSRLIAHLLWVCFLVLMAIPAGRPGDAWADQPSTVELFEAAANGNVSLRIIPKNANQATIVIRNETKQPLSIQLPETFVGVLAQMGMGGMGGMGMGGGGQAVGGGMMGGMGGMGMGGGMGGMFNLPPESVRRVRVPTVCLEHGKDDPKPKMAYVLQPLETFTSDPRVIQICKMLGAGTIDTDSAQAAIWHVAAGLSWQELATKVKIQHLDGSSELYFNPQQLERAARIVMAVSQPQPSEPAVVEPRYPNY